MSCTEKPCRDQCCASVPAEASFQAATTAFIMSGLSLALLLLLLGGLHNFDSYGIVCLCYRSKFTLGFAFHCQLRITGNWQETSI